MYKVKCACSEDCEYEGSDSDFDRLADALASHAQKSHDPRMEPKGHWQKTDVRSKRQKEDSKA